MGKGTSAIVYFHEEKNKPQTTQGFNPQMANTYLNCQLSDLEFSEVFGNQLKFLWQRIGGKFIFKKILRSLDKEQILGLNLQISRWGGAPVWKAGQISAC